MRYLITIAGIMAILSSTSCKKCTTCTFDDPERGKLSSEVCGKGNIYQSGIDTHEDNGWTCNE
ncbi:MAG TPA: hypothetical protein DDX92_04765 [Flavobacteriales bacterium]|nr:hypothetical protein [Flavobacteriales bacterium]